MKGDRALIHRAASVLERGSTHTLDLAREALGLSGHPGLDRASNSHFWTPVPIGSGE